MAVMGIECGLATWMYFFPILRATINPVITVSRSLVLRNLAESLRSRAGFDKLIKRQDGVRLRITRSQVVSQVEGTCSRVNLKAQVFTIKTNLRKKPYFKKT